MFAYDIQYGGDPFDKYDLKGQTDYNSFMAVFENFPWQEEVEKVNSNQKGCSPTLSVKNETDENALWVSMSGEKGKYGYLVGYVYNKMKKGLFGFGKERLVKWVEIYLPDEKQQVKELFKIYFERRYDFLLSEIRKFKKFDEMQAWKP